MALLVLPLTALVYLKVRERDQKVLAAYRIELLELRDQIESHVQVLAELGSRIDAAQKEMSRVNLALTGATGTTPPPVVAEMNRRLTALAEQQTELAASLRRSWPSTAENISPEQRQQVHKAALALLDTQLLERRKQADEAEAALESLRVQLAVPDEIVIQNSDAALDDPRLSNYRAYFETKRDRDRIRGFARILETKLAIEKVELSIPRAP